MHTYKRRTAKNSIDFLERIIEQMPFSIQTDRGGEFFAVSFQGEMKRYSIATANRQVQTDQTSFSSSEWESSRCGTERSHQTDLQEFYITADLKDSHLNDRLEEWQFHYNWYRPHSSLQGKTPIDIISEKSAITPFWDDVIDKYDPDNEPILEKNYQWAKKLGQINRKKKPTQ